MAQLEVKMVASGAQLEVQVIASDDLVSWALGTDKDTVFFPRSTSLGANTSLAVGGDDVLIGTPVVQAIPANSLIASVVTENGDMVFVVNNGGNSLEMLRFDASVPEVQISDQVNMRNNDLLNIGAATNDWTASTFKHSGSGGSSMARTASVTNIALEMFRFSLITSGNMANDFGGIIAFRYEDDTSGSIQVGDIGFTRQGADNTTRFTIATYATGTRNDAFRVASDGVISADLAGTGTAAQVDLFDEYDDPIELKRYTHSMASFITEEQREANRQRMIEIGIIEPKGTSEGYMVHIQPLTRLLAGGIYQNRARMDAQYENLNKRLDAIGA